MPGFGGPGFAGLDPGRGRTHRSSSHAEEASHIELEELTTITHNYVLGLWGGGKKRGRLATDISLGPIFLTKKNTDF